MKNLLNYQSSEYDCGPISLTNAIRYLCEREEIYPDIIKYIMLYCLDSYDEKGEIGKHGTSATAMMFLSNWLNQFGKMKHFPIACEFITGEDVYLATDSKIICALQQGGAVVLRVTLDVGHYVLLTGIEGDKLYLFDPYYEEEGDPNFSKDYYDPGIIFINDRPKYANRLVSIEKINRFSEGYYEMGPYEIREAVILFNENTRLLPEKTIDYFI